MTPFQKTVEAHAKLNLTLDVGPRRDDGYHDVDSVVVRLTPSDEIAVQARPGKGAVRLVVKDRRPDAIAHPPIPRGPENLVHRAATLARERWAPDAAVDLWITLVKRIPTEAGLGAGSSDAAEILRLLADAAGATIEDARALAPQIGSDVALFLTDGPVRMGGRGEVVAPAELSLPTLHGVLVRPASGVPTGPAYAALDAVPGRVPGAATRRLLEAGSFSPELLGNDFAGPVADAFPDVAAALAAVGDAGAVRAHLCGSGSAVFGLARDPAHALELTRTLATAFPWVKKVTTLP